MAKKKTVAELQQLIKEQQYELAEQSFYYFIKQAWNAIENTTFIDSWHIGCLSSHIEAHLNGESSLRKLIINQPPGTSKSRVCTIFSTAWDWIHRPQREVLLASNSHRMICELGDNIRNLITSEWYYQYWCEQKNLFKPSSSLWTKNQFALTTGGFLKGVSPDSKITGLGSSGRGIWDDLNNLQDYLNPEQLRKDNDWNDSTFYSRFRHSDVLKLVVQQRVGQEDITAHLLANEQGWFQLILPMEYTKHFTFNSPLGQEYNDPRKEGELLVPNRFTGDWLYPIKKDRVKWQSAYQQQPVSAEGSLIKTKWLKYVDYLPKYFDTVIISADLAVKAKAENDYTVFLVLGKTDSSIYLIDMVRDKMDFDVQLETFKELVNKYPEATAKLIEDKQTGTALIASLTKLIPGLIPVDPGNKASKEQRMQACIPLFIAGNLFFPNPSKHEWIKPFIDELLSFPLSTHDDCCDSYVQAITYLSILNSSLTTTYIPTTKKNLYSSIVKDLQVTGSYGVNQKRTNIWK